MSRVPAGLWQNLIAVQVYGANTGVGKTVFSTLLGAHFSKRVGNTRWRLRYIKPVSTGPSTEADDRYVRWHTGADASTLYKFKDPVSPHVAARGAKFVPDDETLNVRLLANLKNDARECSMGQGEIGITIVETAGGVLSPGPSGRPQADLFRPLRLPVVLVGDHRLGGIASTISAAESLIIRGYDIDAVVCFNDYSANENAEYLQRHFQNMEIAAFELPWIPNLNDCSESEENEKMKAYYEKNSIKGPIHKIAGRIIDRHFDRLTNMKNLAHRTKKAIWHPFTQHKSVENANDILVFDSAYGDYFQTKHTRKSLEGVENKEEAPLLYPAFDGSASWWTQGLGHGNPKLSLAAAYAAGRYGHVMFAGATHEPALTLAERLLTGLKNPRLEKVFYSDDGSTAAEVGIKMALRAACKRYDWDGSTEDIGILGLKGSYHGDTIGAMDASEPCVYNKKVDWYRGRGYWFDFPSVKMRKGRWLVESPTGMEGAFGPTQYFEHLKDVFDFETRDCSPRYEAYIRSILDKLVKEQGRKFGALVMEPILLGAGGMQFVDPLFQRSLVKTVREYNFTSSEPTLEEENAWKGLPVMFDEVFTGLYRLGRFSAASFLQIHPDISIHAKLLTGGLLPLSVTLASRSIFDAFWGDEKSDALLHGHSYTAHPIGCHVANTSLQTMQDLNNSYAWRILANRWAKSGDEGQRKFRIGGLQEEDGIWSMWRREVVTKLSCHENVDHVFAIGSVLVVSVTDKSGSGYTSNAAIGLRDALLNDESPATPRVHCRVLGNVIYLMASMTSKPGHLLGVEHALVQKLNKLSAA